MHTSSRQLSPELKALQEGWLFWLALLLGGFLAVYTPWCFWAEAEKLRSSGSPGAFVALVLLSSIALFTGLRWCILLLLSYCRTVAPPPEDAVLLPFVSILMPAYNEAECIESALEGLMALEYPAFEVILIDDGSPDETYALARPYQGRHWTRHGHCDIRVFTKANGGKWSAHNFGLKHATGELILCIDADSRLEPPSLRRLVRRMGAPQVGAVSGQIRVRNRGTLLTRLQALEYVMANGTFRLAQAASGSVMIVPGPIGLFRRRVLDEICVTFPPAHLESVPAEWQGPFSDATFAEDFNLSLAILMLGYRIDYEPDAISHTRSPDTVKTLINQRYRWTRGTLQVLKWFFQQQKHGRIVPRLRLGLWVNLTLLFDSLVLPAVQVTMTFGLIFYFLSGADLASLFAWTSTVWVLNLIAGSFFLLAHEDDLGLLAYIPLFDFYQGVMLSGGWMIAALDEVRGARMRW